MDAVLSYEGKTFAMIEAGGKPIGDADMSGWLVFRENQEVSMPVIHTDTVWDVDEEGVFLMLGGEKVYLDPKPDGTFEYRDQNMLFASEGPVFDILDSQPKTDVQKKFAGGWVGFLQLDDAEANRELAGEYAYLFDEYIRLFGEAEIDLDGNGTMHLYVVDVNDYPELDTMGPQFSADVQALDTETISLSNIHFLGKLYTEDDQNTRFDESIYVEMKSYQDEIGALPATLVIDPILYHIDGMLPYETYTFSWGEMGFANPEYDTEDGIIWDGKWSGDAWVKEASGRSQYLLDTTFEVVGSIGVISDYGIRVLDIYSEAQTLMHYAIKADNRHFEIHMDTPEGFNYYGILSNEIRGDHEPGAEPLRYIKEEDDLFNFAAFFPPGVRDRFVLVQYVADPDDYNNYYTVIYDMYRDAE